MRKLIPLFLLIVFASFAADKPAATPKSTTVSAEDKLALREAQVNAQQAQLVVLDLANKIMQANAQLAERQKSAQEAQTALGDKVQEVTEKLRKASGCSDCVLTDKLEFSKPPKDEATPPAAK